MLPRSIARFRFPLIAGSIILLTPLPYAQGQETPVPPGPKIADELSKSFEQVAASITPSVVTIATEIKAKKNQQKVPEQFHDFFGDDFFDHMMPGPQRGLGTGVVVDEEGHILTNNHVIGDADQVTVRFGDDRVVKAEVVGSDPRTDLAVIKMKTIDKSLRPARLGDSDQLKIGEWVVAAGASFGLENTITAGIVSAKGRALNGGAQYEDFIQTDAAINPGNSGGPLVNLYGEVVGINTAIVSKSGGYMGIGFAIPINMAKSVMKSLISKGKVTRGWLGVGIQNLSEDLAQSFNYSSTEGALVGHVDPKGPAKKAGLKQGDIIVQIGDQKVKNVNQLRNYVAGLTPGQSADVTVIREGKKVTVPTAIGELPSQVDEQPAAPQQADDIGISVDDLTPALSRRLKTTRRAGVVVTETDPQGLAAKNDIQPGDIIISINGNDVTDTNQFNDELKKANVSKGIRLVIESQGMERFVFLKSDE